MMRSSIRARSVTSSIFQPEAGERRKAGGRNDRAPCALSTPVLLVMLSFALLPFAAPVAMHLGWNGIGEGLYRFYALFCHQLPQRSWFLFGEKLTYTLSEIRQAAPTLTPENMRQLIGNETMGWKVAWSDRMIAFYTMTPVFGLVYVWLSHRIALRPLPLKALLLALFPLAIDGVSHALNDALFGPSSTEGFRTTNAWLATLTSNRFPGFYAGDHLGTFNWWVRLLTGMLAAWAVAFTLFPSLDRFGVRGQPNHETRSQTTR